MEYYDNSQANSGASDALDNLLLLVAVIVLTGACLTIVGILPVVILVVGAVLAIRTRNLANIRVTTRFVQIVAAAVAIYCLVNAYHYEKEAQYVSKNMEELRLNFSPQDALPLGYDELRAKYGAAADSIFLALSSYRSLHGQMSVGQNAKTDMRNYWILGAAAATGSIAFLNFCWYRPLSRNVDRIRNFVFRGKQPHNIINRESMTTYSVADELQKWAKLKEGGHINEDEYQQARQKLLRGPQ